MTRAGPARVLLVDNYDSYTYNLHQLIGTVCGAAPTVLRNDALPPLAELERHFSHVVVSPGPGHPGDPRSVGDAGALCRTTALPVLGVCLGHQLLATTWGGTVHRTIPRHGHLSRIRHDGRGVFRGLPQHYQVVRYHSLAVVEPPPDFEVTAVAEDGVIMGIRHRRLPLDGVQFHPESVSTEWGQRLVANFLGDPPAREVVTLAAGTAGDPGGRRLRWEEVAWRDPEDVFVAMQADDPRIVWLDSAARSAGRGRFSYLGSPGGPAGHWLTYAVGDRGVRVGTGTGEYLHEGDIFTVLEQRLAQRRLADHDAPFPFHGGYVGYLGYELKALCGGARRHRAATPDASFLFIDRFLAFDHERRTLYVAAVDGAGAGEWLRSTVRRLGDLRCAPPPARGAELGPARASLDPSAYRAAFAQVQRYLRRGDSYEVNLTYQTEWATTVDEVGLYRHLRSVNPAPFAAFYRSPEVTVLSSSPEEFLFLDADGVVRTRPIKGTAPRHADPFDDAVAARRLRGDPKTFAENLMIVDLLRHDLGQVCQLGSVEVPELMAVESHPTVHQLVTTVTGRLRPDVGAVGCLRAMFPGGSMTGAPKLRTMEIIDEVEAGPRGVYSGALGFFSLCGRAHFNIVIRTLVKQGDRVHVGAGGAVVVASGAEPERQEAELKLSALREALGRAAGPDRWRHPEPDDGAPEVAGELPEGRRRDVERAKSP